MEERNEKSRAFYSFEVPSREASPMRAPHNRKLWRLIPVVVAALYLASMFHYTPRSIPIPGYRPNNYYPLNRYPGESVIWTPCGTVADRPLECSSIDVPMDHFAGPASINAADKKTFTLPLIRLRGNASATESILLNPGGPGGSGIEFIYRRGKQLSDIVGGGFHLLGFEPRGINSSFPNATCYPDKDAESNQREADDPNVEWDSGPALARARNYATACRDTMGEFGKYINTPQTAADMNSILDAIGQKDMVYWGFSYGTLLGQTYATMYPDRSKRVIIDGVVNQFDWYQSLFDWEAMTDTENVFAGFLDECIKAGPKNCSLAGVADTKEELYEKIMNITDALIDDPLAVYVNSSVYGLLYRSTVLYEAIFPALYKPANWYALASKLAPLLQGNATEMFLAYGRDSKAFDVSQDANAFVSLSDGLSGAAHFPQDREGLVRAALPFWNMSMFGMTEFEGYFRRQQWVVEKTHGYVPRKGVKTAHPLLILSTSFDPICPLVSARSANEAFEGSRIVEVLGYGHCSVAVASMCLARNVRAFLYEGKMPEENVQCEVDGPYFVAPEEGAKGEVVEVMAQKHFEDPEERRIHLAQLELARDSWFPMV